MVHLQAIFQCTIRILEVAYVIACELYEEESISLKLFPLLGKKLISSFQCDDQHTAITTFLCVLVFIPLLKFDDNLIFRSR